MDIESHIKDGLSGRTLQNELFASKLSVSLREVRFHKQEFPAGKSISNIKYFYPSSQNNNLFHLFNDQLDYILATYFAKSKTIKGNVNKFHSNRLIVPLIEKLFYGDIDKWIEKLSNTSWNIPTNK